MRSQEGFQPQLRERANEILRRLPSSEREALLVKCWMSHDARWFMAVAREYGLPVANHLNRIAAHEVGKVEAQRVVRALQLPPVVTLDDYLLAQEALIGLLGPDLLDYHLTKAGDHACRIQVRRCFAHENAVRAGIADEYECGIFARVTGWLDGLGLPYETNPAPGKCLKSQGRECVYTITLVGTPD